MSSANFFLLDKIIFLISTNDIWEGNSSDNKKDIIKNTQSDHMTEIEIVLVLSKMFINKIIDKSTELTKKKTP